MGTICMRQMLGMLRCHCRGLFKFLPAPRLVCTGVDISQCPTQTKRGDGRSDSFKRWGHAHSSQQRATAPIKQTLEDHLGPISVKAMVPECGPLVLIISGPSGVGKDAVIKSLREAQPELVFVVTATTRAMRPGESDGQDYFFVSKQEFHKWLEQGDLLEHAMVYGEYKGIPRSQVEQALERGSDVVLRVDVQGAETIRQILPHSVSIFLVADSEAELVARLVARKTEPLEKLLTRVHTARSEFKQIDSFDYVVVNREGRLVETVEAISAVIQAEKLKVWRTHSKRSEHISQQQSVEPQWMKHR